MIVADPPVTDAEVCGACSKVRPARSIQQCTLTRALAVLERGYCMCPLVAQEAPGGLAALSPETQELYRPLMELSAEYPPPPVGLLVATEPEAWEEIPQEASTAELPIPDKAASARRKHGKRKRRGETKTVQVVELTPMSDPSCSEPVWTHPTEAPTAGARPVPVIDGGGVITGPQTIPEE